MLPILLLLLPLPIPSAQGVLAETLTATIRAQDDRTETKQLTDQLIQARTVQDRDAAFEALIALAESEVGAEAALVEAFQARWANSWARVTKGGFVRKLEKLANKRKDLDEARKAALDLIFDEKRFFYPYRQPEVSAKRAAEYPGVKREVLTFVKDVHKVWNSTPKVRVPKNTRADLVELLWLTKHAKQAEAKLEMPVGSPAWLQFIPVNVDTLTFENFPLTEVESLRMIRDSKVLAYNERLWEAQKPSKKRGRDKPTPGETERMASEAEREQVRITNRYRITMGHRAVTWDADLQAATRMHSDYMAKTGEFSHYEKDPDRKTPFDRMRLVGYTRGASENCSNGAGDPQGAHDGWLGSSGHHRNLLNPNHFQMASAGKGPYWTQNFGVDSRAEKDL
jgi:uncharacterized protein YkwD